MLISGMGGNRVSALSVKRSAALAEGTGIDKGTPVRVQTWSPGKDREWVQPPRVKRWPAERGPQVEGGVADNGRAQRWLTGGRWGGEHMRRWMEMLLALSRELVHNLPTSRRM